MSLLPCVSGCRSSPSCVNTITGNILFNRKKPFFNNTNIEKKAIKFIKFKSIIWKSDKIPWAFSQQTISKICYIGWQHVLNKCIKVMEKPAKEQTYNFSIHKSSLYDKTAYLSLLKQGNKCTDIASPFSVKIWSKVIQVLILQYMYTHLFLEMLCIIT